MELIDFGSAKTSNVVVVLPPKEGDEKVAVVQPKTEETKTKLKPEIPSNMVYMAIPQRTEPYKISREDAINGLNEKTYYRVQVSQGKNGAKSTVDRFTCEPYAPFQVFDGNTHHVGGCHSAAEAIELAEISVQVDKTM